MPTHLPLNFTRRSPGEMLTAAQRFRATMQTRRTVRDFSPEPVPRELLEESLRAAGTAPSGANLQPWHFAVVSDPALKHEIRVAAEEEERAFYARRATPAWLQALAPLGTTDAKPFLEIAPWLIAIFAAQSYVNPLAEREPTYYAKESVGIATGLLIAALHHAGLATLTHTPSPMKFLNSLLGRPVHEKPFLLLVVGFPAEDVTVPAITRKPLDQIASFR